MEVPPVLIEGISPQSVSQLSLLFSTCLPDSHIMCKPPRVFEIRNIGCSENPYQKEIWSQEWANPEESSFFCNFSWIPDFRTQKGSQVWLLEVQLIILVASLIKNTILGPTVKKLVYEPWKWKYCSLPREPLKVREATEKKHKGRRQSVPRCQAACLL